MGLLDEHFIEVKNASKVTYSESDLNKLDRMYEAEVFEKKKKKILSPMRKEMQRSFLSQVRDYAFERILDRHLYTFKYILVIPNPYGVVKQSALLLFNSSKVCRVHYCVMGDEPENNFEGDSVLTTRHRVPVLGLYQGRNNKVDLKLIDEEGNLIKHRVLNIYVSPVKDSIMEIVGRTDKELSHFPFMLLNGIFFNPIAIDKAGKLRYALQCRTGKLGMIPLKNGRFLLADKMANRMNEYGEIQPCRYHEMDYMGRVYKTFLLEYRIGRAITQDGDSLFLVTSSDKEHISDMIIEVDMNSGKIVNRCNISSVLSDKYRTESNWADITRLEYHDGMLYASIKKLHTIVKLDWKKRKVKWVLASSYVWKGTFVEKYLLKTEDTNTNKAVLSNQEYFSVDTGSQDGIYNIIIFDTKSVGSVKNGYKAAGDSAVKIIEINEEHKSYKVIREVNVKKSPRYGSIFISDNGKYMLAAEGILKQRDKKCRAQIVEINMSNTKQRRKAEFTKAFISTWAFKPDLADYCQSMEKNDNALLGKLNPPEEYYGELPEISEEKIDRDYFGRVKLCDSLFLFNMEPGMIQRIYFVGEKNSYVEDYSEITPTDKRCYFAIPLDGLAKDEYYVYVECQGVLHKLKNEIRIAGKNEKIL